MQAEVLANLGSNASRAQQLEKGIAYYERALQLMWEVGHDVGICVVHRDMGVSYYFIGDFPKTLDHFHKALAAVEGSTHYAELIKTLDYLSEVYISFEDYDNALIYLERASQTWEAAYGQKKNSELSSKKGRVLLLRKNYAEALQVLKESQQLKIEARQFIPADLYQNLGQCYEMLSQPDSALFYYEQAVDIASGSKNFMIQSQSFSGLGRLYEKQGAIAKAQNCYREAYTIATQAGQKEKKMDAAAGLYQTYKNQNNYPEALRYLEITKTIQDSLFNEKNTKEITRMEANYEFEKEKQQLAFEQEKELERQGNIRRILWLALAGTILLLLIGYRYFRSKQKANKKLQLLNNEILAQKSVVESQAQQLTQSLEELQQKNEAILLAQNQLIQQEKMASLGQLTVGLAHEIKNPLNFINNFAEGSVELLQELQEEAAQIKQHVSGSVFKEINLLIQDIAQNAKDIKENGTRLDRIVYSMMDHARGARKERRAIDLNQLVDDNVNLAYHGYRALEPDFHVDILKNYDPDILPVEVFPQELGRVLLNILNNACYAIHQKNKEHPKEYDPVIEITTRYSPNENNTEKDRVEIRIKDNGTGIPDDVKDKIFDPFFTTKPTGKGNTGLGLSISYDIIVNGHQGNLSVETEPRHFTEFIISLPFTEKHSEGP